MDNNQLYCTSLFEYKRNRTTPITVGNIGIGGDNPIRVQSMTTTDTLDAEASAQQCIEIIDAGAELVRLTTQGKREAENLRNIKQILTSKGYNTPLVADIHFNPVAAETAAAIADKVRINPGNFVGGAKKFDFDAYANSDDNEAIEEIKAKFIPLLNICKANHTALRLGVNHGSLSDRIMARYGDTPAGMVASCMEYLRICRENDFHDIVISIKSSNTRVMVHTVRLLAATMLAEGMSYPLHLGVTEAGSEEEGRIKSAVGTGALLADGLGDTIRISLTEDPALEIPVANKLLGHITARASHQPIRPVDASSYHPFDYERRKSSAVLNVGGNKVPVAITSSLSEGAQIPDFVVDNEGDDEYLVSTTTNIRYPVYSRKDIDKLGSSTAFVKLTYPQLDDDAIKVLKRVDKTIIIAHSDHVNVPAELRAFILALNSNGIGHPVVLSLDYNVSDVETFQIAAAADAGILFLDGLADGLWITNNGLDNKLVIDVVFGILQASRVRFSKTDFISCPGCGRTLFDLRDTTKEIKLRTSHLKGLKIGIMGCIVNGIGEMADADYGYVGSGPHKVSLYKNKELLVKNIPETEAVEALINLIKENGDWADPK